MISLGYVQGWVYRYRTRRAWQLRRASDCNPVQGRTVEQDRLFHLEQEVMRTAQVLYQWRRQAQEQVAMSLKSLIKWGKRICGKVQSTAYDVMRLESFAKKGVTASAEIDTLKRDLADAEKEIHYLEESLRKIKRADQRFCGGDATRAGTAQAICSGVSI